MVTKNWIIIDNELYNIVKGKIIAVNDNGTYDVEISDTGNKYPHVKNIDCETKFKMGEIINVGLEHESKKLPIIIN